MGETFGEEITFLKSWIGDRLFFLDSQWGYEPPIEENIIVYPNPFSNYINFNFSDKTIDIHPVFVYDLFGKKVYESSVYHRENLSLSFLEKGVYILKVSLGNNTWHTQKLIKQ